MTYFRDYTVRDFMNELRSGQYAWPGGYPKFFLTSDGEALSYKYAKENIFAICRAIRDGLNDGWRVVACDVNWEDPDLFCAGGDRIESAYAEREES